MKRTLVLLICFLFSFQIYAQTWTNIGSAFPSPVKISLVSANIQNSSFTVDLKGFYLHDVTTPSGIQNTLSVEDATPILQAGAPDLPKITTSVIIPDNQQMEAVVTYSNYVDYPNIIIAPSKGNFTRDINPADVPYVYGPEYTQNQFYPGNLVSMNDPYILRDFRGQTVITYPFQYNPVTKVLRVYNNLTVNVHATNAVPVVNPFVRMSSLNSVNKEFSNIYGGHFLNYAANHKYTPLEEQGNMLIICYDAFMSAMQPLVDWKNDEGIPTTMVGISTAGSTAAAIKAYVTNYYNTNGLTYLLLVGDVAQCPTFTVAGGGSDPSYGYIAGADHFQEIFVGRFSAENVTQVTTQVNRTISYERNPQVATGKFNHCVGIGSDQGPGDDNEYDYQHQRNMLDKLTAYTYLSRAELFDGDQGGVDATGYATANQLSTEITKGSGIITYCGHGSDNQFVTTGFSNTDVAALTNTDMWPFIWSVACVNGNFTAGTCFAEAWLRATSGGQPTGAVATFMSTINQSWNPPMDAQDEMVDILTESYTNNIKRTFGGLSVNGVFKMNDSYADYDMTDTWTIFGDPSLMVRTDNPQYICVSHPNFIRQMADTNFLITSTLNGAEICLTLNHQILATGKVTGNAVHLSLPALNVGDSILITATAYNYVPYQKKIVVVNDAGIHSYDDNSNITIYPNPSNHQLVNIVLSGAIQPSSISIYNMLGEKLDDVSLNSESVGSSVYHYNTSNLESGVYYVVISNSNNKIVKKMVIGE